MGANNVLPSVPAFTAGSPTIAQLNALSYATTFLIDHGTRPTWHFFMYATQALGANAWTAVAFDHVAYDSDGVYSSVNHGANIVTQGYYEMEACVQLKAGANKDDYAVCFAWSPQSGNPYFSHGATNFGYKANSLPQTGSAAADGCLNIFGISPYPVYPGDLLQVLVWSAAAHTVDFNQNTSYNQGRFSTQFTGRWAFSGS
jgi:hypothetical protein